MVVSERRERQEAWAGFVAAFPWDWFATFTFRGVLDRRTGERIDVPVGTAHGLFRGFCEDIGKVTGKPTLWFRCDEYGPRTGRFHIHSLLAGVGDLSRIAWLEEWNRRSGWARIFPFDPSKGGARYCAKYVAKDLGDWELVGSPVMVEPAQRAMFPLDGVIRRRPVEERPVLHHAGIPLAGRFRRADWESLMLRHGRE